MMKLFKILMICGLLSAFQISFAGTDAWKQNNFIITFWCPPPADKETLSRVAKEGFNLTWTDEHGLDVAHEQGLRAMLQDDLLTPRTLLSPEQRAKLDALINRVKNHPALEAYFIADEPGVFHFNSLGQLVAYLRDRDPNHFAYINLFPVYATNKQLGTSGPPQKAYEEYLRRYIAEVRPSLISYDHYHFFKNNDGDKYFLNLELIKRAAQEYGLPFMNIIQASAYEKSWRLVNADELRWLVYTTLAYGGRGISYFLYWGPPTYGGLYQGGVKTPLADDVSLLNKELSAQSAVLMALEHLGTYHTGQIPSGAQPIPVSSPVKFARNGDFVLGLFGKNNKVTTFMVVNRKYKEQATALIALKPHIKGMEEFDRNLRQWKKYKKFKKFNSDDLYSVLLNPGDGRLFRFIP
jgi:hypothetical protein